MNANTVTYGNGTSTRLTNCNNEDNNFIGGVVSLLLVMMEKETTRDDDGGNLMFLRVRTWFSEWQQ
jgi:hypothetical protein